MPENLSGRAPRSARVAPDNHPPIPLGRPVRSGARDPLNDLAGSGHSPTGPSEGKGGVVVRGEPQREVTRPEAVRE